MKRLYKLKNLAWIGVTALVAFLFWMLVAGLITKFRATQPDEQLYTIRHQDLRDNNPLYTNLLLNSIKAHGGYLVLGTSESNARTKGNYYDFLNADTALNCRFSVIAGAGRTACTYFPLIQGNDNIKNVKVLYYINPSYWCGKLATGNLDYFHRYVSFTAYRKANQAGNQEVDNILKTNLEPVLWTEKLNDPLEYWMDRIRRKYYQDLVFDLDSSKFYDGLNKVKRQDAYPSAASVAKPDSSRYQYALNVAKSFDVHSYTLHPHPEEAYRYDELRTMIRLCKERGVDIVFIVGPYNHVAFAQVQPGDLPKIRQIPVNILRLLEEEGAEYIDCSDLSTEPGMFEDWQHHTSYGATFIYQKIRDYVLEKENR